MKRALIIGISGQDGAYLSRLLLDKGYEVHGTSRDSERTSFWRLEALGVLNRVRLHSMALTEFHNVIQKMVQVEPDEVYNLAGQSSVGLSFEQPFETLTSISLGTLNILEAIRFFGKQVRLYNAGSSESFGDVGTGPAGIDTPFNPRSPYAVAKAAAFWEVANYREAYGLHACSGVLFNHESPLRASRFVTKKIVSAACRVSAGSDEVLKLGNIEVKRDWGWAPEYVEAMWLMLQQDAPRDYVIATGKQFSLQDFVREAFKCVNLSWEDHVRIDSGLLRPTDIEMNMGDASLAKRDMGWEAKFDMYDVVRMMVHAERQGLSSV